MAYLFRPVFQANLYVMWFVCDCVMVKDQFYGDFKTVRDLTLCSGMTKSLEKWKTGVCPNFRTPL